MRYGEGEEVSKVDADLLLAKYQPKNHRWGFVLINSAKKPIRDKHYNYLVEWGDIIRIHFKKLGIYKIFIKKEAFEYLINHGYDFWVSDNDYDPLLHWALTDTQIKELKGSRRGLRA